MHWPPFWRGYSGDPERYAGELGCERVLASLPDLVCRGGGAGRQRRAHEIAGMDALLRELTGLQTPGPVEPASQRVVRPGAGGAADRR